MNPNFFLELYNNPFVYTSFFSFIMLSFFFLLSDYTLLLSIFVLYCLALYVTIKALDLNKNNNENNRYRYNAAIADLYD